jgi:hypothetical protein
LKIQLVAKGIIKIDDWDELKQKMAIKYRRDNQFSELKEIELLNNRLAVLQQIDPYLGKYYSKQWIQKHVLRLTEEETEEMDKEVEDNLKNLPELQPEDDKQ